MATKKTATTTADEDVVPNVHAEAFAERQRDPNRYDDPTIATPGILEDVEGDGHPAALIDPGQDVGLDPAVDNRDQVQPMLDTLYADAIEKTEEVDPEATAARLEESREAQREAAPAPADAS
jgi:hypothetical protein